MEPPEGLTGVIKKLLLLGGEVVLSASGVGTVVDLGIENKYIAKMQLQAN